MFFLFFFFFIFPLGFCYMNDITTARHAAKEKVRIAVLGRS